MYSKMHTLCLGPRMTFMWHFDTVDIKLDRKISFWKGLYCLYIHNLILDKCTTQGTFPRPFLSRYSYHRYSPIYAGEGCWVCIVLGPCTSSNHHQHIWTPIIGEGKNDLGNVPSVYKQGAFPRSFYLEHMDPATTTSVHIWTYIYHSSR